MRDYFYELAEFLKTTLTKQEIYTAYLSGEDSDFCRLNQSKVRQAGHVTQAQLVLKLIDGQKSAEASLSLSLVKADDAVRLKSMVQTLRGQIGELPDDPYLLYATDVNSSEDLRDNKLIDGRDVIAHVTEKTKALDLVGIYASGAIYRGFANSFGQRNWYESYSFNLDWSFYLRADKAVKTGYAGFEWSDLEFDRKVARAVEQLAVLETPSRTIAPGRYRVYLAPRAVQEITDMLSWGGFGLKSHKTKNSSLIKMTDEALRMSPKVSFWEHTAGGIAPNFNADGFVKPDKVALIEHGVYKDCLVSPRSSKEYGVPTNGSDGGEYPHSLEIEAGDLALDRIGETVGEGLYINDLWYLNFSDRPACRVTGMTRFASFWVEGGKIVAPLAVMRFDDSVLKMFGEQLVGLTQERELLLSASTYGQRSTASGRLPGAVIDGMSFTL